MRFVPLLLFALAALGVLTSPAGAEPYWIAYEGNDLPENEGWTRYWGNWDGPYEGDGAIRTLQDGILTMDSLFDPGVYDYARIDRPGRIDPGAGEVFLMEWRVLVDQIAGEPYFATEVGVSSDDARQLGFGMYPDAVVSSFEDISVSVQPGVFHEYRVVSPDMRTYTLYIDGEFALMGEFWEGLAQSRVGWGEGVLGVAARARWDYCRMGVVPEPACVASLMTLCGLGALILNKRRRTTRGD